MNVLSDNKVQTQPPLALHQGAVQRNIPLMNFAKKYFLPLILVLAGLHASLPAAEPGGKWTAPNAQGRPWKHDPTKLSFPAYLGHYRFAGNFEYQDGGVLLRYENLEEQGRMDIFLFKAGTPLPANEDKHRRILTEMDTVVTDMESMVKQGRYKNVNMGETIGGELELWQKQSIPIATRVITATRIGNAGNGSEEAVVRQWVGITILDDYLITLRHMRPAKTGDAGEESMKKLIGLVFQVIKDPALRAHIQELVNDYLKDPFSEHGVQASGAVMAYLGQTPYFPINIPEDPFAAWLAHFKAIAPGTEDHLLRAFMLGSAKAAFADGDATKCLNAGALQFAKIYRQLASQHSQLSRPEIEEFVTAAEAGKADVWMQAHSLKK